jgi:hypothetical protein
MKEFGKRNRVPVERHEFRLNYQDADEETQVFEGRLMPRTSAGDLAVMMEASRTGDPKVLSGVIRILTKVMDNKDGVVPARWKPTPLKREPGDEREPSYRGPDGEIYALTDEAARDKFNDQANWTTRRRWVEFIEENDDAVVEMEDLAEIVQWVVGLATDRPTEPRA